MTTPILYSFRRCPYAMRARLAELFELEADAVNVKGKSGEKLDAVGRGEALRATAVVLLAQGGA